MFRTSLGIIGHYSVILAFVSALVATYTYWKASLDKTSDKKYWLKISRISFGIHTIGILAIVISLFTIIFNKYFEYH